MMMNMMLVMTAVMMRRRRKSEEDDNDKEETDEEDDDAVDDVSRRCPVSVPWCPMVSRGVTMVFRWCLGGVLVVARWFPDSVPSVP